MTLGEVKAKVAENQKLGNTGSDLGELFAMAARGGGGDSRESSGARRCVLPAGHPVLH